MLKISESHISGQQQQCPRCVWCAQVRGEVFVDNPDQRIQDDVRAFATTSVRQPVITTQGTDYKRGITREGRVVLKGRPVSPMDRLVSVRNPTAWICATDPR